MLRWKLGLGPGADIGLPPPLPDDACQPSQVAPDFSAIAQPDPSRVVATWVGHSTFLLQLGGRNFLTDPHFGSHCSPLPIPGFRRKTSPGIAIEQLPRIDAILLSHCHYDHLDLPSLRKVAPGKVIFCPVGVGRLLSNVGASRIVEVSWGESVEFEGVDLFCLPAQHGSARTPFDRNCSLWCGWLLQTSERRAAFIGDSGYAPIFTEIGEAFGPIDFAMIPIGAYRPEWFMRPLHMNPEEAVRVHLDLKARQSVAMHWGTFLLADDSLGEPPRLLEAAKRTTAVGQEAFRIPSLGQTFII